MKCSFMPRERDKRPHAEENPRANQSKSNILICRGYYFGNGIVPVEQSLKENGGNQKERRQRKLHASMITYPALTYHSHGQTLDQSRQRA